MNYILTCFMFYNLVQFQDPKDTPPPTKIETREERLERKKREKAEKAAYIKEQGIALCNALKLFYCLTCWFIICFFLFIGDPHNDPNATADPYKTLFIARINTDSSESKLKKEFEAYGPVRKVFLLYICIYNLALQLGLLYLQVTMIYDKISAKPKGYAFVEFENEKDMHCKLSNFICFCSHIRCSAR